MCRNGVSDIEAGELFPWVATKSDLFFCSDAAVAGLPQFGRVKAVQADALPPQRAAIGHSLRAVPIGSRSASAAHVSRLAIGR